MKRISWFLQVRKEMSDCDQNRESRAQQLGRRWRCSSAVKGQGLYCTRMPSSTPSVVGGKAMKRNKEEAPSVYLYSVSIPSLCWLFITLARRGIITSKFEILELRPSALLVDFPVSG